MDMTKRQTAVSNIGIERFHRLDLWAKDIAAALKCEALLGGSAVRFKQWNDLDVYFVFTEEQWKTEPGLSAWLTGPKWLLNCAAFSAHGTALVGAPVEAHFMARPAYCIPDFQTVPLGQPW